AATQSGAGPLQAITLALVVGAAAGLLNGVGVGVFRVHPLIMTIGMSSVLLGIVSVGLASGGFLTGPAVVPPLLTTLGGGTLVGPVPMNVVVWAGASVVLLLGLVRTGLGRTIYAVGDNPTACRLSGVEVWQVLIATYVIVGILAAGGGLPTSGRSSSPSSTVCSSRSAPARPSSRSSTARSCSRWPGSTSPSPDNAPTDATKGGANHRAARRGAADDDALVSATDTRR